MSEALEKRRRIASLGLGKAAASKKRAKKLILCDTNVVLDYYRDKEPMKKEMDALGFERLAISTITVGEFFFLMRNNEKRKTKEVLNKFQLQSLTPEISSLFEQLMYEHHNKHPDLPDCLIAATAIVSNAYLFTFNKKHFEYYKGISFYNPKYTHKA